MKKKLADFRLGDVEDPQLYGSLHVQSLIDTGVIEQSSDIWIEYRGSELGWNCTVYDGSREQKPEPEVSVKPDLERQEAFWNSLTPEQQLDAYLAIRSRLK
jgi:hypothetical protein